MNSCATDVPLSFSLTPGRASCCYVACRMICLPWAGGSSRSVPTTQLLLLLLTFLLGLGLGLGHSPYVLPHSYYYSRTYPQLAHSYYYSRTS